MSELFEGIDESEWPLVHVDVETLATTAGDDAMLKALDALLARNERFGLAFEGRRMPGSRDRSQEWLVERNDDLGRLLIGLAYTVAPATLARNRELAAAMPYPFPVWPATTGEECKEWLRERIADEVTAGHT